MKPLSSKKRNIILTAFIIIFAIVLPFLILYSIGFRFSNKSLVKTGGLYVHKPIVDATISLDNKPLDERLTSFLQRYYFVQSLRPEDYTVKAEFPDYYTWEKTIPVLSQRITEVAPFLIAQKPQTTLVPQFLNSSDNATEDVSSESTLRITASGDKNNIPNPLYKKVKNLFEEAKTQWEDEEKDYNELIIAYNKLIVQTPGAPDPLETEGLNENSSTIIEQPKLHIKVRQKIEVWRDENSLNIISQLEKDSTSLPFFCNTVEVCRLPQTITDVRANSRFDFFPGRNDVIIVQKNDGIYAVELDGRGTRNIFPLYLGKDISFVVEDSNQIYIRDAKDYYLLELD